MTQPTTDEARPAQRRRDGARPARAAVTIGGLGMVFGDIGTSPLYTIQTVFNPEDLHPVEATAGHVFGIVSLIFWAVTLIVTVKYVFLVLRADNNGEGGILALITLIQRRGARSGRRTTMVLASLGGSERPCSSATA